MLLLFSAPTGLAVGLAPEERRYAADRCDSPRTTWFPRSRAAGRAGTRLWLLAARHPSRRSEQNAAGRLSPEPPHPEPNTGTVVAALGDSITAGAPRWDPNPDAREQIGSQLDRFSQYELWAERALPETDFRNCGIPGELSVPTEAVYIDSITIDERRV